MEDKALASFDFEGLQQIRRVYKAVKDVVASWDASAWADMPSWRYR